MSKSIKDPYNIQKQTFALHITPVLFNTAKSCSQYYAIYDKANRHQNLIKTVISLTS